MNSHKGVGSLRYPVPRSVLYFAFYQLDILRVLLTWNYSSYFRRLISKLDNSLNMKIIYIVLDCKTF